MSTQEIDDTETTMTAKETQKKDIMNYYANDYHVKEFCRIELVAAPGQQIKASDLYARFRAVYCMVDISDVKLAELFSKHMQSKRVASGKVYLDYRIEYELDWPGPKEDEIKQETKVFWLSGPLDLGHLGQAIRNLRVTGLKGDMEITLVSGLTDNMYNLYKTDNEYILPPGLWITPNGYDIWYLVARQETNTQEVPTKTLLLSSWSSSKADTIISISYESCCTPKRFNFHNEVTYEGHLTSYNQTASGKSYFSTERPQIEMPAAFKNIGCWIPEHEVYPALRCGFYGVRYTGTKRENIADPCLMLLTLGARVSGTHIDYVTQDHEYGTSPTIYLRKEESGYRYCASFVVERGADIIDNITIANCPIPPSLLKCTLWLNNSEQFDLDGNLAYYMCATVNTLRLDIETTFVIPDLDYHIKVGGEHTLARCRLRARVFYLDMPLRRRKVRRGIYDNIDEVFGAFASAGEPEQL